MLARALALAGQALYITSPNPRVGCILTDPQGQVLGQGHTQPAGQSHAEIMALRDAQSQGRSLRGATAYVTLEPCAHHGRTGPCADALLAAGIARVVACSTDPNPQVAGAGFARLRAGGVTVSVLPPDHALAQQARELNIGFFSRMLRGRPWVRLKLAASLDGRTALPNGASQWITDAPARADGHAWRARACAILTGMGTVRADNPRLTVRAVATPRQPMAVLIDSRLEVDPNAALFEAPRANLVYAAVKNDAKESALRARGVTVLHVPETGRAKVDLHAMLRDLGARQINELHVEAGHLLSGSLLRAGVVDELLVYQAPLLLDQGAGMVALGTLTELTQGLRLQYHAVERIGPDLRLILRPAQAAAF